MRTTISVIVETATGATSGIDRLLSLFNDYEIKTSFFVSLGPDRTAGYLKRRQAANHLAGHRENFIQIASAGHDLGMAPWDSAQWAKQAARADEAWTSEQWDRALAAWQSVFSTTPDSHASTDCQANPWLFQLEQESGLAFASDVLGKSPFFPVMQKQQSQCLQLPVTLHPMTAIRSGENVSKEKLHEELYDMSQKLLPMGQHWRISADENPELVEKMVVMWKGSSREFLPLSAIADASRNRDIKQHTVGWDNLADGSFAATQSLPFGDTCG